MTEKPMSDALALAELQTALDEAIGGRGPLDSDRRFYPLGAHPATYRDRYIFDALRRVASTAVRRPGEGVYDKQIAEAMRYHVRKIVEVEAGELEAKAQYLREWADVYDPGDR